MDSLNPSHDVPSLGVIFSHDKSTDTVDSGGREVGTDQPCKQIPGVFLVTSVLSLFMMERPGFSQTFQTHAAIIERHENGGRDRQATLGPRNPPAGTEEGAGAGAEFHDDFRAADRSPVHGRRSRRN